MKLTLIATTLAFCLPLAFSAHAADADDAGGWTGTGELGFAMTRGNTRSQTLNAKLNFKREDETWKNAFYVTALRNKGETTVTRVVDGEQVSTEVFSTTANRVEAGASVGYKLTPRSYIVGALRYEHDEYATYRWQAAASVGYGYILIRNPSTELSFEIGPGFKRVQPSDAVVIQGTPPAAVHIQPPSEDDWIGRGLVNYSYKFNKHTALKNTLLIEAGSNGRYVQNDLSLVVQMSDTLALKVSHQLRYNSVVSPDTKHSDQLLTVNLVYSFM